MLNCPDVKNKLMKVPQGPWEEGLMQEGAKAPFVPATNGHPRLASMGLRKVPLIKKNSERPHTGVTSQGLAFIPISLQYESCGVGV
jgi:hypothetical protein